MRVTTTIRNHVTRDTRHGEVSFDEENEIVGVVVERGEDVEPLITIESVDGVPARGLSQQERDTFEERLWFAYLDQTEQGVQP